MSTEKICDAIRNETGINKRTCRRVIAEYHRAIARSLIEGKRIRIEKVITLIVQEVRPRTGFIFGKPYRGRSHKLHCEISKSLRDAINREGKV